MKCVTTFIELNGKQQEMLIVTSESELEFADKSLIIGIENDSYSNEIVETAYSTEGFIYKEEVNSGIYYYWFVLKSKQSKTIVTYKEDVEGLKLRTLDLENAIAELAFGGEIQ